MKTLFVLLLSAFWPFFARADDAAIEKSCREFLRHLPVVKFAESGTSVRFTGKFKPIAAELRTELDRQFPNYSFRIAKMEYLHWGWDPVCLSLVLDRRDSSVRSYLWDLWFEDAPFSFRTTFNQLGTAVEEARARLSVLARLICFQMEWTAGKLTVEDGVIFVPLLNRQKEPSRIMRSRVTPDFPGEWLAFVGPEDKYKKASK